MARCLGGVASKAAPFIGEALSGAGSVISKLPYGEKSAGRCGKGSAVGDRESSRSRCTGYSRVLQRRDRAHQSTHPAVAQQSRVKSKSERTVENVVGQEAIAVVKLPEPQKLLPAVAENTTGSAIHEAANQQWMRSQGEWITERMSQSGKSLPDLFEYRFRHNASRRGLGFVEEEHHIRPRWLGGAADSPTLRTRMGLHRGADTGMHQELNRWLVDRGVIPAKAYQRCSICPTSVAFRSVEREPS